PITLLTNTEEFHQENLLNIWPEYIEKLCFKDSQIYRIFVYRDNDYMEIYYYFPNPEPSLEIKLWLEENTPDEIEINNNLTS
ncbi:MAG: hypothetical protein ACOCRO_06420, partial [Halanaerobiales bacterium]